MKHPNQAYAVNIPYITAYFRQQYCPMLKWIGALSGYPPLSESSAGLPHLELGFGQGLGLSIALITQSEPQYGVDFMRSAVDEVTQRFSRLNCDVSDYVLCMDFDTFLHTNQQTFQTISLHGVWSWVDPMVRHQLTQIIERFLIEDGLLYISYNVLPGQARILPIQRLIHHSARSVASHTQDLGLAFALSAVQSATKLSQFGQAHPCLTDWWQGLEGESNTYLQHEYLGQAWYPMLFADIAQELQQAHLSFVSSADAIELLPELHLTPAQLEWLSAIDDPVLYQSYADYLRNQSFRRDIWSKSQQRLTIQDQWKQLQSVELMLIQPKDVVSINILEGFGQSHHLLFLIDYLASESYRSKTVFDMVEHCKINAIHFMETDWIHLLIQLTAIGAIQPSQSVMNQARLAKVQAFNWQIIESTWQGNENNLYLASLKVQAGIQVSPWQQRWMWACFQTQSLDTQKWVTWCVSKQMHSDLDVDVLLKMAHDFLNNRFPLLMAHQVVDQICCELA